MKKWRFLEPFAIIGFVIVLPLILFVSLYNPDIFVELGSSLFKKQE